MKTTQIKENILEQLEGISCEKASNILYQCQMEIKKKAIYKPKPPSIFEMLFGVIDILKNQK